MTRKQLLISSAAIVVVAVVLLVLPDKSRETYFNNKGQVFGTYYAVQYENSQDLHDSLQAAFAAFDASLSMFNPNSTLSHINNGTDFLLDDYFLDMYRNAVEVNQLSSGAFDITVAPLVNLWGFGLKNRTNVSQEDVDNLLPHIGMNLISLHNEGDGHTYLVKDDPEVQLDCGAVAKGQCCDIIAALLVRNGCQNYLVDIGGEVVAHGVNAEGNPWRIGITRPIDDASGMINEVEVVLQTTDIAMATSGNYRNFYYDGEQKRSHTIDPRTGYPVQHTLLSATVRSNTCMRADALATACMVLGEEEAMKMIEADSLSSCYFIVAEPGAVGDSTVLMPVMSSRWVE